jgi:phosphate:Na+ symporter
VPGSRLLALLVLLTATAAPAGGVDWWAFGLRVLAGLVLFLFGVDLLARALRDAAGDRFRALLARTASNRFAGLGMGTAATVVLDSSSVTIIMLIALVDAQLLRSADALAMVLGSNIGTTFSSQVFAWNVDAVAPVMMAGGFLARVLARSDGARRWGDAALGLGLVLFGLSLIEGAAAPLERHPEVVGLLRRLDQPLIGALAGAAVTAAIQSSSATIGIVIALAGAGLIGLPAGVAIMLGAEIGTCADTLVATLGRSRAAVRTGLFHLGFNIVSVAIGLLLVDRIAAFGRSTAGDVGQQIANAHVLFNVAGALLLLPLVGVADRWLRLLLPDRARDAPATAALA